jgi:hypothetical protein
MTSRTTYARATRPSLEYDEAHAKELLRVIFDAIYDASIVSDVNASVIRPGECAQALITVLAAILAMSPSVTRSPAAIRETVDEIGKRLRRNIAAAEKNKALQDFIARCFRGNDIEGSA